MSEYTTIRKAAPSQYRAYLGETFVGEAATTAYLRGHRDGRKDMEIELLKQAKALFQLAMQKAENITAQLVQAADEAGITVYNLHLKVEDWDKISSLIIVKMEDYVDDKIETLYRAARQISEEVNDENFRWDYAITYNADSLNTEKIVSDGYQFLYEHIAEPRKAQ